MANKKLIQTMLEETQKRLESDQDSQARLEVMERFTRRLSLTGKADQALAQIQNQLSTVKKAIKHHNDFIKFLKEIENE